MLKKYLMITILCLGASLLTIQTVSASTDSISVTSKFDGYFDTKASYKTLGVSIASSYLNIRKQQSTNAEIVGKLYSGAAAIVDSIEGDWVKISSGSITGYVYKPYLTIGFAAQKVLIQSANPVVTVNTQTLRVRKTKSDSSQVIGLVSLGEKFQVLSRTSKWTKIKYNGTIGYLSNDYINLSYSFTYAVAVGESPEKNKEESNSSDFIETDDTAKDNENSENTNEIVNTSEIEDSDSSISDKIIFSENDANIGFKIASFAQQFLGNPYASGGTSLTDGADCSGFLLTVFKQFDYNLPRTSKEQAVSGIAVNENEIQPGDIVSYATNGVVTHVALYIGNGLVIHSSTPKDGIKLNKYNYRAIYSIRRIAS